MKIELISTKMNPLLGRREVDFEIQESSTPSRVDTRKEIAAQMKVDLERVYLVKLETKTGTQKTVGRAHVYDKVDRARLVEREHILERNKLPIKER